MKQPDLPTRAPSCAPLASHWRCRCLKRFSRVVLRMQKAGPAPGQHLHAAGPASRILLPGESRQRLRAHALSGVVQRLPRRLHRDLRPRASGCRFQPRFDLQFSDRRAAPGSSRRLSQQHFARSIRCRTHRTANALSKPLAFRGRLRPVMDAQRRARAVGPLPCERFARLFLEGRPDEVRPRPGACARPEHPRHGPGAGAQKQSSLGTRDREKVDEYFTSVRELEQRMVGQRRMGQEAQAQSRRQAAAEQHETLPILSAKTSLMFDLMHLALQTDSTRLISLLLLGTSLVPPINGVSMGHHDLSHHGKDPKKSSSSKPSSWRK